jgi:hypothetical protein
MALLLGNYVREVDEAPVTEKPSLALEEQCIVAEKLAGAAPAKEVAMDSVKDTILLEYEKRP